MSDERTPQERMVQLIENKIEDMKARAAILKMDGQALIAKGDTIYYEAMALGNDLYKFKNANQELFPEDE